MSSLAKTPTELYSPFLPPLSGAEGSEYSQRLFSPRIICRDYPGVVLNPAEPAEYWISPKQPLRIISQDGTIHIFSYEVDPFGGELTLAHRSYKEEFPTPFFIPANITEKDIERQRLLALKRIHLDRADDTDYETAFDDKELATWDEVALKDSFTWYANRPENRIPLDHTVLAKDAVNFDRGQVARDIDREERRQKFIAERAFGCPEDDPEGWEKAHSENLWDIRSRVLAVEEERVCRQAAAQRRLKHLARAQANARSRPTQEEEFATECALARLDISTSCVLSNGDRVTMSDIVIPETGNAVRTESVVPQGHESPEVQEPKPRDPSRNRVEKDARREARLRWRSTDSRKIDEATWATAEEDLTDTDSDSSALTDSESEEEVDSDSRRSRHKEVKGKAACKRIQSQSPPAPKPMSTLTLPRIPKKKKAVKSVIVRVPTPSPERANPNKGARGRRSGKQRRTDGRRSPSSERKSARVEAGPSKQASERSDRKRARDQKPVGRVDRPTRPAVKSSKGAAEFTSDGIDMNRKQLRMHRPVIARTFLMRHVTRAMMESIVDEMAQANSVGTWHHDHEELVKLAIGFAPSAYDILHSRHLPIWFVAEYMDINTRDMRPREIIARALDFMARTVNVSQDYINECEDMAETARIERGLRKRKARGSARQSPQAQ